MVIVDHSLFSLSYKDDRGIAKVKVKKDVTWGLEVECDIPGVLWVAYNVY